MDLFGAGSVSCSIGLFLRYVRILTGFMVVYLKVEVILVHWSGCNFGLLGIAYLEYNRDIMVHFQRFRWLGARRNGVIVVQIV